jgi:GNAT superfamily N-acetyltransferase
MNDIKIRTAKNTDLETLFHFQKAMAQESEGITLDQEKLTAGLTAILSDTIIGTYYVAQLDGKTIACIMVTKEWSEWRNGHALWIQSVYVKPENRRQGVYRHMYEYLQCIARQEPSIIGIRLYVEKENHKARSVYRELGMDENRYIVCEWLKTSH